MVMNPRTHPRGARPDFTLPRPNPNPARMTDALWWLVCMRLALEPGSQNGGTYANKPGYHNAGENVADHGLGNPKTDHSIRRGPDRTGPWWREKSSAHDWTFPDAHHGDYKTIIKYTKRLVNSMRDPDDIRPDDVYAYTIGQIDGDPVVEGYNEYRNAPETGDKSHLWHRHDSFRRSAIGSFWMMWRALTIDMGWTYAEWLKSTAEPAKPVTPPKENPVPAQWTDVIKVSKTTGAELFDPDKPEGAEVPAATLLQLAAIWARRAANNTDSVEAALAAQETHLLEIKQALSRIEEQLRPVESPPESP